MKSLDDGVCDLIYIDPPFVTQRKRTHRASGAKYDDRWSGGLKQFLAFLHPRLSECHRLLSERGTLYVHLDWRAAHYVRVLLDTIFGERNFLNEVIWHYRTGGLSTKWFARKHDTILVYAKKAGSHSFQVQREGTFRTDGLNYDEDGRPYKNTKKGRLYFNAAGPALSDVWDMPFLSTVSLERVDWPTQKPVALLERIIRSSSREGDLIADFFCGSGTTLVAAMGLGRRAIGCDIESRAVAITRERLKKICATRPVFSSAPRTNRPHKLPSESSARR
ncbi:MAG: site-specific DNA-methyltransferase [Planctomycetes bacterium]|nr:site-specific DNA-methyltransferase [Planctomycetota bacterium]